MTGTTALVSGDWLVNRLDDRRIRILEVSAGGTDSRYRKGHIPSARWCNWKELCWHATDRKFPTPGEMANRLGGMGISADSTLIVYGDPVQYGTYAYWVLAMCGHDNLRLLDGALGKWKGDNRPLSTEIPEPAPCDYRARKADVSLHVGRDNVRNNLERPGRLLLDLRSPEEYSGERVMPPPGFDHGAERRGRIPGAVHLFYRELLNDDDTFKSPKELSEILTRVGATPDGPAEIVTYCRLSHRATIAWFAMTHILGFENVKVYDGSWTEWGSIVDFPIEK